MNRWSDWWEQAKRDLDHAAHALDDRDFELAAFAAQQAAEKALIMSRSGEAEGAIRDAAFLIENCRGRLPRQE